MAFPTWTRWPKPPKLTILIINLPTCDSCLELRIRTSAGTEFWPHALRGAVHVLNDFLCLCVMMPETRIREKGETTSIKVMDGCQTTLDRNSWFRLHDMIILYSEYDDTRNHCSLLNGQKCIILFGICIGGAMHLSRLLLQHACAPKDEIWRRRR